MDDTSQISIFSPKRDDDMSSPKFRLEIGILGFLLPFVVFLTAGLRPIKGMKPWELLGSLSAYYYTEAMFYFVGILLVLGVFLVMYRGYGNKHKVLDQWSVTIAGIAAAGVAIFSCEPPDGIISGHKDWMSHIHYSCAAVMFFAFIFISFFLFTKSKDKKYDVGKRIRNFFYRLFGLLMFLCIIWIFIIKQFNNNKSIFLPESSAVLLFSLSWLLKGRADYVLVKAGKLTYNYVSQPRRLVTKVRDIARS